MMKLTLIFLLAPLVSVAQTMTVAPAEQATRDQARKALLVQELRIEVEQLQNATTSGSAPDAALHRANIAALSRELKITAVAAPTHRPKKSARWCDAFCNGRSSSNHDEARP